MGLKLSSLANVTITLFVLLVASFLFYCENNNTNIISFFGEEYNTRQEILDEQDNYMEITKKFRMIIGETNLKNTNNTVTNITLKPYFSNLTDSSKQELNKLYIQGEIAYKKLIANIYAYNLKYGYTTDKKWLDVEFYDPYINNKPFSFNNHSTFKPYGFYPNFNLYQSNKRSNKIIIIGNDTIKR